MSDPVPASTADWVAVSLDMPGCPTHIIPLGDLRPHELDTDNTCWCRPEWTDDGEVDHKALDQRERYAEGGDLHVH